MPASILAQRKAAQAWCRPTTGCKAIDPELLEAFAEVIDDIWSRPWLGNATTGQLLDEVKARVDCDYKTVGGEELSNRPPAVGEVNRQWFVYRVKISPTVLNGLRPEMPYCEEGPVQGLFVGTEEEVINFCDRAALDLCNESGDERLGYRIANQFSH